ncbi:pilus assembly protein CpaC [Rubricella aquisinus]|uniref:Pilus assembly protein CpaC n=1 Tax=Rubricella aquisinus TaxID=2028108 RepID=A0A840WXN2_9RHOB|nr:type II and III secretion system protein family protein [Rubricella aquisinus]MBB5515930.1 pilus assembly protein CpaC [Rubricella aquisinus]
MTLNQVIRALGTAIGVALAASPVMAQTSVSPLRVLSTATTDTIDVPIDRAIVIETARPVGELSIANPRIADVAVLGDQNLYVLGRATGRTTLTLIDERGDLLANIEIAVTPDVSEFKERLREILPGEPIEVRTANDGLVLSGAVSGARQVARAVELANRYAPDAVTSLLTVGGTQQVLLEVQFAEMQRTVAKQLGASLAGIGPGNNQIGTRTLIQGNNLNNILTNQPVTLAQNQLGAALLGFQSGSFTLNLLLEALETKGLVRTLAEPNVVAISGQEATFLAGGEYPLPTIANNQNGVAQVEVQYKPFGVELGFIPTVIDSDLINLQVRTAVSAVDPNISITVNGATVNGFTVRRAQTTVEMRDGESFAIAGLIQDDFTDTKNAIPWLGDVPILGALFRSAAFQREQTELVIVITPHLVSPTDGSTLSLPTDRVRIPNEFELFLNGQVEGSAEVARIANQAFEGEYGYVIE